MVCFAFLNFRKYMLHIRQLTKALPRFGASQSATASSPMWGIWRGSPWWYSTTPTVSGKIPQITTMSYAALFEDPRELASPRCPMQLAVFPFSAWLLFIIRLTLQIPGRANPRFLLFDAWERSANSLFLLQRPPVHRFGI